MGWRWDLKKARMLLYAEQYEGEERVVMGW